MGDIASHEPVLFPSPFQMPDGQLAEEELPLATNFLKAKTLVSQGCRDNDALSAPRYCAFVIGADALVDEILVVKGRATPVVRQQTVRPRIEVRWHSVLECFVRACVVVLRTEAVEATLLRA